MATSKQNIITQLVDGKLDIQLHVRWLNKK